MRFSVVLAAVLLGIAPASAFEWGPIDRSHVYVSEPGACSGLEGGFAIDWEGPYFTALSFADAGIYGLDLGCDFYEVREREGSEYLLVDAICHGLGDSYADQLVIGPFDEDVIHVVSSFERTREMIAAGPDPDAHYGAGVTFYHACRGIAELPL